MKKYLIDVAERTVWTYIETLVGLLAVSGPLNLSAIEAAAVAALPAAAAIVKGAIAGQFGVKGSAAALPASVDAPVSVDAPGADG